MDDIMLCGHGDISWNCSCGAHNVELHVELHSIDSNEYECKECNKKYVFRVDLELEEVED